MKTTILIFAIVCVALGDWSPKVTVMHVTDVHGWVFGHPHNETLNADFGDFASLVQHMKEYAENNNEVFLLFDSGDLIEGTGLSDATPIHGEYIFPIVKMVQNYNGLTMGNHDIGHDNTVELMRTSFINYWNGSYLAANSIWKEDQEDLGAPYQVIEVNGMRILALGYLYNFTQSCNDTEVVDVSDSLLETYFQNAMDEENIDFVVVIAHIDPKSPPELRQIYKAIRNAQPNVPILLLSGHAHEKYYEWYDWNAFTIESGKYFQVLGLVTFYIDDSGNFADFEHQWVDTSRENFYKLAKKDSSDFMTPEGETIRELLTTLYNKLGLNETLGCSPITYSQYAPLNESNSLFSLYINEILPAELFTAMSNQSQYFMCNPYSLRDNLYKGTVTKNDVISIMPFGDSFYYFPSMTGSEIQSLVANANHIPMDKHKRGFVIDTPRYESSGYYTSNTTLVDSQTYDLVCSAYDTIDLGDVLNKLFPGKFQAVPYPGSLTSTVCLENYLKQYMHC